MSDPVNKKLNSIKSRGWWMVLGYLCMAAVFLGPTITAGNLIGFFTVDMADTMYLKQAVAHSILGKDFLAEHPLQPDIWPLLPNMADHLTALAVSWLPFPLGENLWWLLCWSAGGISAHCVARKLDAPEKAAWLCGSMWMFSEASLREMNLFHAPQSMTFLMPIFVLCLIRWNRSGQSRDAAFAGVAFAANCLIYWYNGFFLGLVALPFIIKNRHRSTTIFILTVVILCVTPLALLFNLNSPLMLHATDPALNEASQIWVADKSHRPSMVLLLAVVLGLRQNKKASVEWLCIGLVAFVLSTGGVIWQSVQNLGFVFERLHWPVRWSIVLPVVMLPLLARQERAGLWLGAFFVETLLLSPNLPIGQTNIKPYQCLSQLASVEGAVMEVGYTHPPQRPWVALHQRFHQRPVVGPLATPPGQNGSQDWQNWNIENPWDDRFAGRAPWPETPGKELQNQGIDAIILAQGPLSSLTETQQNSFALQISSRLGAPDYLGCALVWWTMESPPESKIFSVEIPKVEQRTVIDRLDAVGSTN